MKRRDLQDLVWGTRESPKQCSTLPPSRNVCMFSSFKKKDWEFPDGPVVKTVSSNAGGAGLIPGHGAKTPYASWPKHKTEAIL